MKSARILVIFSFFLIGVFVDSVSVKEGDLVTLHTDLTEIQKSDSVEWRLFNGSLIAKINWKSDELSGWVITDGAFKGRLQLDKKTGDLNITNLRTTDSGQYKLKIKSPRGSPDKIFTVNVDFDADKDLVKKVPVTVEKPVTLITKKQRDEVMKWRFGPQNTLIAELKVGADNFNVYEDVLDGRFKDRLKLDHQSGSLTITNTRTEHTGVYKAEISSSGYTILKAFNVTVTETLKLVSVEEGDSVILHTGLTQIQTDDVILWRFGDQDDFIAILNSPVVDRRWSKVHLNDQTGNLNIRNIQRNQSGDYKVEINTTNMISHRKYHINISVVPGPDPGPDPDRGLSSGAIAGIIIAVLAAVAAAVGGIYYGYGKKGQML